MVWVECYRDPCYMVPSTSREVDYDSGSLGPHSGSPLAAPNATTHCLRTFPSESP